MPMPVNSLPVDHNNPPPDAGSSAAITETTSYRPQLIAVHKVPERFALSVDNASSDGRSWCRRLQRVTRWLFPSAGYQLPPEQQALDQIISTGQALRNAAENLAAQRAQQQDAAVTSCRPGWKAAAMLLLAGAGSGLAGAYGYQRFRSTDAPPSGEPEPLPEPAAAATKCWQVLYGALRPINWEIPCIPYPYTDQQPEKCLTSSFKQKCATTHAQHKNRLTRLILHVGKTPCLCPPPANGRFVMVPLPGMGQKKTRPTATSTIRPDNPPSVTPPSTTTSQPTMTATFTSDSVSSETGTVTFPASPANSTTAPQKERMLHDRPQYMVPLPEEAKRAGRPQDKSGEAVKDDVKITKLYDFSCIEARSSLSWTDILRQIGATLSAPVSRLSEEANIIQQHNQLKQGCPDPESNQGLQEITGKIDSILTLVLTMLPGSQPLAIAQMLIGPALQLAADDLDDKPSSPAGLGALNQQLLTMFRQAIPSLTPPEIAALYAPPAATKAIMPHRFRLHNGVTQVAINGVDYPLKTTSNGSPFINLEGHNRFIAFNHQLNCWELASPAYSRRYWSAEIQRNKRVYGIPLSSLSDKATISNDNRVANTLIVNTGSGNVFTAVAMDDLLLPVEMVRVNEKDVVTTISADSTERRLLSWSHYGWSFEPASAPMDDYLRLLLSGKDNGVTYTPERPFTYFDENGICYNSQEQPYIKLQHRYYRLLTLASANSYHVFGHPDSLIGWQDGLFKLIRAPEILFSFNNVRIGSRYLEPPGKLQMETGARDYLRQHGRYTSWTPVSRAGPGVYFNEQKTPIFTGDYEAWQVSSYHDRQLKITRHPNEGQREDIALWLDDDTWLRVREKKKHYHQDYRAFIPCRATRSPGQGKSCTPVMIENALDDVLTQQIEAGKVTSQKIVSKPLTEVNLFEFPGLFFDLVDLKYAFLYKGHFFDASLLEARDERNISGTIALRLYSRGNLLRRRAEIATVVIERQAEHIELKNEQTFLAEKLNINKAMAAKHIRDRPYRHATGMQTLEDAVAQLTLSGRHYIAKPRREYAPDLLDESLRKRAIRTLFPYVISDSSQYETLLFSLNDSDSASPPAIQQAQKIVKDSLDYIRHFFIPVLLVAQENIAASFHGENLWRYLQDIFHTDNPEFFNDFLFALRGVLSRIGGVLHMDKISLMTTVPRNKQAADTLLQEMLTPIGRLKGRTAFIAPDRSERLFLNIDKLPADKSRGDYIPSVTFINQLLHEAAHSGSMTSDFFAAPKENELLLPLADAIDTLIDQIRHGMVANPNRLKQLSQEYLLNIAVYRNRVDSLLENHSLAWLAEQDPGYLAHLILNSADMLTRLMQDMYQIAVFEEPLGAASTKPAKTFTDTLLSGAEYRKVGTLMARGSIGTVYDLHNGYLIKDYSGTVTPQYKSRLQAAMNNVNAMNRIYGAHSATVILHPLPGGSSTVSVKMIKVPGLPLSAIFSLNPDMVQLRYRRALQNLITPEHNPAEKLAQTLGAHGVMHYDINEANLLFDTRQGFQLVDFDSATLRSPGETLSKEAVEEMATHLKVLIARLARLAALNTDEVQRNLAMQPRSDAGRHLMH